MYIVFLFFKSFVNFFLLKGKRFWDLKNFSIILVIKKEINNNSVMENWEIIYK